MHAPYLLEGEGIVVCKLFKLLFEDPVNLVAAFLIIYAGLEVLLRVVVNI